MVLLSVSLPSSHTLLPLARSAAPPLMALTAVDAWVPTSRLQLFQLQTADADVAQTITDATRVIISTLADTPLAPIAAPISSLDASLQPIALLAGFYAATIVAKVALQVVLAILLTAGQNFNTLPANRYEYGQRLGSGNFGAVYEGFVGDSEDPSVVIKSMCLDTNLPNGNAREFAKSELFMYQKLSLCGAAGRIARYKGHFYEERNKGDTLNIVYDYEGESTLADFIEDRDFPWNVEGQLLGKTSDEKSLKQRAKVIRRISAQLFGALADLHSWNIVHRDIKGSNLILAKKSKCFKLIDFGAACDLFTKRNYDPKVNLLDPDFGPPEATFDMEKGGIVVGAGGKFDVFSAGLLVMQMCFPAYRGRFGAASLQKSLLQCDYDLAAWRATVKNKNGLDEGFKILDESGGFKLLELCLRKEPGSRISSANAARSLFCLLS